MTDLKTPIILIGFKHAGKTVLGAALAKVLKMDFTDLDAMIELHYLQSMGEALTCRKMVHKHGIDYFRSLESHILKKVMDMKPSILALGGGTPLKTANQELIAKGTVIQIKAPKGRVFERIMMQGRPAFFPDGEDAFDAFIRIWEEREPIYHRIADYYIDNTGSIEEGVQQILASLKQENVA